jgi:ribosomal protein S1
LDGVVEKRVPQGLILWLPGAGPGVTGFLAGEELEGEAKADLRRQFPPGKKVRVEVLAMEPGGRIRLSQRAVGDRETRDAYRSFTAREDTSGKLATFGDLFKDLKLPPKKD